MLNPPRVLGKQAAHPWLGATIVLVGTVLALVCLQPFAAGYGNYRLTLARILATGWSDPTWQHGALAPLIAGWLVWHARKDLRNIEVKPSPWGLPLLLAGFGCYYVGFKANFYHFGFASIQMLAAGSILWIFGSGHFKRLFFAWLILAFIWPLRFLEDTLAFQLRLIVVDGVASVLQWSGIDIVRDGTTLVSPPDAATGRAAGEWFSLNVDGPCSGMRSLFALMMVSALFSYFRQRGWQRRLALFACSLPLAILANMARILLLLTASVLMGQELAIGGPDKEVSTFHFFSGIAVFLVALAGLQGASWAMDRWWRVKVQPSTGRP